IEVGGHRKDDERGLLARQDEIGVGIQLAFFGRRERIKAACVEPGDRFLEERGDILRAHTLFDAHLHTDELEVARRDAARHREHVLRRSERVLARNHDASLEEPRNKLKERRRADDALLLEIARDLLERRSLFDGDERLLGKARRRRQEERVAYHARKNEKEHAFERLPRALVAFEVARHAAEKHEDIEGEVERIRNAHPEHPAKAFNHVGSSGRSGGASLRLLATRLRPGVLMPELGKCQIVASSSTLMKMGDWSIGTKKYARFWKKKNSFFLNAFFLIFIKSCHG